MSEQKLWYLPNDNTLEPSGPFSAEEIITKIRAGELRADDFIFNSSTQDSAWRRVWEFDEFTSSFRTHPVCPLPQKFSRGRTAESKLDRTKFASIKGDYGTGNLYRRHPRVPFICQAIIHNQENIVFGRTVDISEMGVSIAVADSEHIKKGSEAVITVRGGDEIGTFSAKAVVVRTLDKETFAFYFLNLNPRQRRRIAQLVLRVLDQLSGSEKAS